MRSAGSTMRGINGRGSRPMRTQNLADVERGRLSRLASQMTALWASTVLEHRPRLGSQFWQGRLGARRQNRAGATGTLACRGCFLLFSIARGARSEGGRSSGLHHSRHSGGTLCMGMAAGSSHRKIKGGGRVLPIVTGNWLIRYYHFRTKNIRRGAGSFGACYGFPGRGSQSFSVLTPDISS